MSLKQNDEYYEQQREMQEENVTVWSLLSEVLKLLVLMGLWYLGFLALYAFSG